MCGANSLTTVPCRTCPDLLPSGFSGPSMFWIWTFAGLFAEWSHNDSHCQSLSDLCCRPLSQTNSVDKLPKLLFRSLSSSRALSRRALSMSGCSSLCVCCGLWAAEWSSRIPCLHERGGSAAYPWNARGTEWSRCRGSIHLSCSVFSPSALSPRLFSSALFLSS